MTAPIFRKYLSSETPNLSLQENTAVSLQWQKAGVFKGLSVTQADIATTPGSIIFSLTAGAFIHNGITVQYPNDFQVTLTVPAAFSISDTLNLVAQANGPVMTATPIWSLISGSALLAQTDPDNFAAVISSYYLKLPSNSLQSTISMASDGATAQWTPSVGGDHFAILNGITGAYLTGAAGNADNIKLQTLPSISASEVTQAVLTLSVAAGYAATTPATGTVTLAGGNSSNLDRFSIFADGVEIAYISAGVKTPTEIATALVAAVNAGGSAWGTIATASNGGPVPVITISSVQYGRRANFDLEVSTTSATTTIAVSVAMTGGTQSSILIEFPMKNGGISAITPMTVYPPITHSGTATDHFFTISFALQAPGITAATFNDLLMRITATLVGGDAVYISRAALLVTFSETNGGIDPAPPTNIFHWRPGANVSVGGGDGSSLLAHRTANPFDHPARSVPREGIQFGAVGPLELSQLTVGAGYREAFHTATQLLTPWTITGSELQLKEVSDLIKLLAQTVGSGPTGLSAMFARQHGASTGDHTSVLVAGLDGGATHNGMQIAESAVPGDSGIDPAGGSADVGTLAQFAIGRDATHSPLVGYRDVTIGAGNVQAFGVTSGDIGGNADATLREVAFLTSMAIASRWTTFALTNAGTQDLYGIKSINKISVSSLQSARSSLFSGGVTFMQTAAPWTARATGGGGSDVYTNLIGLHDAAAATDDATAAAGNQDASKSHNPNPRGCVLYCGRNGVAKRNASGTLTSTATTGNGDFASKGFFFNPEILGTPSNLCPIWLYLPFPNKDKFDRVVVRVNARTSVDATFAGFLQRMQGFLCFPAYDNIGVGAYNLVAPTIPAPSANGFSMQATGIVRRQPWVLTPSGFKRPQGADAFTGVYFDPTAGVAEFFSGSPLTRGTALQAAGQADPGSMIEPTPLPYYDCINVAQAALGGVLVDSAQGVSALSDFTAYDVENTAHYYASSYTNEATIYLRDKNTMDLITLPGNARTPDGIAICMATFDDALFSGIAGITNVGGKNWTYHANIEIEGISDGVEQKLLTAL